MKSEAITTNTEAKRYHHGELREALLTAAETVLERDGLEKLTLRAIAREAGVSHAAPKNHFPILAALLSELAIIGFNRLAAMMRETVEQAVDERSKRVATGQGYIHFARDNPELFMLLFRGERLDYSNERLTVAARNAFMGLSVSEDIEPSLISKDEDVVLMAARWSMVHGYAMLMIDGRIDRLLSGTGSALSEEELSALIFNHAPRKP